MSRVYVPGERRVVRDRFAAARRALRRRARAPRAAAARFVANRSDRQLERLPVDPAFVWTLPLALRMMFTPKQAVDLDGTDVNGAILLEVRRKRGPRCDRFVVTIERRRCRIRRQRAGDPPPDGTMSLALADLVRMAAAAADPERLVADGQLQITGDTFLVIRFPALFRQPTRAVI